MYVIQSHKMCSSLSPRMGKHTRKKKVLSVAEIYHLRNLSPSMTAAITQEDIYLLFWGLTPNEKCLPHSLAISELLTLFVFTLCNGDPELGVLVKRNFPRKKESTLANEAWKMKTPSYAPRHVSGLVVSSVSLSLSLSLYLSHSHSLTLSLSVILYMVQSGLRYDERHWHLIRVTEVTVVYWGVSFFRVYLFLDL